jgi:hypothetical protein
LEIVTRMAGSLVSLYRRPGATAQPASSNWAVADDSSETGIHTFKPLRP